MSLNATPSGERLHIGFFGRRNAGKSSLVNAFTGQSLSVVSDVKGTTTDPVSKAMELLPLGPVVIIDTPGFDDVGALGAERVRRTKEVLRRVDIAVLVVDGTTGKTAADEELLSIFQQKNIPCVIAYNKSDIAEETHTDGIAVSALTNHNIPLLKETVAHLVQTDTAQRRVCGDLVNAGDVAVLVVPIDKAAPKGRLILPQQQTIRDLLDAGAVPVVCRDAELALTLQKLAAPPQLVITDSQAFGKVKDVVPESVPLTSFSILRARYKGFWETAVTGAAAIERLQNGSRILIAEGCTHHRQCDDIGTVKLPRMLRSYSKKDIIIETCSGKSFPDDLSPYDLIIHCGGCMLNEREVQYRHAVAQASGIPFTNYGTALAYMQGILTRTLSMFPDLAAIADRAGRR